jgi:cation-transporting ATPase 13A1
LLLRGTCVVNEAMLTGESVPQVKETLQNADQKEAVLDLGSEDNVNTEWRRHVLFSGTTLLIHTELTDGERIESTLADANNHQTLLASRAHENASAGRFVPNAPNNGCVAVVVRTGFGTSQVSAISCFFVLMFRYHSVLFVLHRVMLRRIELLIYILFQLTNQIFLNEFFTMTITKTIHNRAA